MSCFKNYQNAYSNLTFDPKILGTLTDDYTGGAACVLPKHIMQTFSDKGAIDFINPSTCEFISPITNNTINLKPTDTGCRIDFSNMTRGEADSNMQVIGDIYYKNVREKILALVAERDQRREAYGFTRSNFDEKNDKLNATLQDYYKEVSDSNFLIRERDQLRKTQAQLAERLKALREEIPKQIKEADRQIDILNNTIKKADNYLKFVTVCEHIDYQGMKQTLKPNAYMYYDTRWSDDQVNQIKNDVVGRIANAIGISSIVIPPGMTARIWSDRNYSGQETLLTHRHFERDKLNYIRVIEIGVRVVKRSVGEIFKKKSIRLIGERFTQEEDIIESFESRPVNFDRLFKTNSTLSPTEILAEYVIHTTYNNRVASIEVQKEKSVGDFMDNWRMQA